MVCITKFYCFLDISFNKIRKIEGIENLTALKSFICSYNEISSIANCFDHLLELNILVLNSNKLENLNEVLEIFFLSLDYFLKKMCETPELGFEPKSIE